MLDFHDIMGMLGDPIVSTGILALVGAVVTRVLLRNHPTRRLVGQLVFFVALTVLLLHHGIVPYEPGPAEASKLQRVFVGLAKVIWWTNAAWSLISVVRVFLIFERQPREGRLLQDLVVGIIYVGAILSVVAYVFDAPVGTLIATSGVFAIILGLALQSTLADVFSGIALNLSKPYGVGDWLSLGNGIEGKVVETNWRATHLLNGANDLVIVPNSDLAKARLTNLSSPQRSHGVSLTVRFRPSRAPSAMVEVMRSVLLSSNSILMSPEPAAQVRALDAGAIELELSFKVADIAAVGPARSEIFDLIYRHAKSAGLDFAAPATAGLPAPPRPDTEEPGDRSMARRLLDAIPLFAALSEEEKDTLAQTTTRRSFRKGEVMAAQGSVPTSLMIMRSGVATVTRHDKAKDSELGRLAPGDFFGEGGLLTGAGEPGAVTALTHVVVYEITQDSLATLLRDRPSMADELGTLLARRSDGGYHAERAPEVAGPLTVSRLTERIRHLFEL
ncbi:mechanosensitive ion channel protein [Bosea sp. Tri-44]|uniref:cyclic nucleotide-binding domain-containing protein n=1 Tax=Bosea sp. Tri-44 TaxID=1972137 RepID=UPI00100E1D05|nr:mechanosensitive ion channel family protein [Bosea sp. Tri-44]RXT56390.1 mechanosensitive ion channel protein [Bosea sp. Tri-44]